jgi:hypothetical protein
MRVQVRVTYAGHLVTVPTEVVYTVEVVRAPEFPPVGTAAGVVTAETGQIVV